MILNSNEPVIIATRGSALALAQANLVLSRLRTTFPTLRFQTKIIKTTGDKLQKASMARAASHLPKGLFTKELEVALLEKQADLAVHSLKDLPTELPEGLVLGAVLERADVRDVLLYRSVAGATEAREGNRGFGVGVKIQDLPPGAVVATSSTRRQAQVRSLNPAARVREIRGNVVTRMEKLLKLGDIDCTLLALAGMNRLGFTVQSDGGITGTGVPTGLLASVLSTEEMLPCVGQGAIGIEVRGDDERIRRLCQCLDHPSTKQCVIAERAFLSGMGGGCQSPVAAYAEVVGDELRMRALSFADGPARRAEGTARVSEARELGQRLAAELKPKAVGE